MNKEFTVQLPKLGESITSATIVQWFKKEGDFVKLDEPLVEVSTDKVNSEIPSPVSGKIKKITAYENQELDVGLPICIIEVGAESSSVSPVVKAPAQTEPAHQISTPSTSQNHDFFSPAVVNLAQQYGISFDELKKIRGSGEGGRVTKKDVEIFAQSRQSKSVESKLQPAIVTSELKGQRIKMDPMRKAIADNMVKSFYTAPHASLIETLDVTDILNWIEKNKTSFLEKYGVKISLTTFLALACAQALKQFPLLNSQVSGDEIVIKDHVNLGLAVSVGSGLLVPVIHACESYGVVDMAKAIADKATRARDGKLMPSEVKEGSFTLTNFGMGGVQIGMPIIRFPEVAIVAIGSINKACLPLDNNSIGIRSVVTMTLTFDHRVVDGLYGCGFINAVKSSLKSLIQ
jgi:2-oxoglutarate dehydrogenase E2 component (dihydrolipoamide succinyltransferase)